MSQQPDPQPSPSRAGAAVDLLIDDLVARKQLGVERYGMPLRALNGRDQLSDALDEALDLAIYLRAAIEERALVDEALFEALRFLSIRGLGALFADGLCAEVLAACGQAAERHSAVLGELRGGS